MHWGDRLRSSSSSASEASSTDGRRGKGPKTTEGKARSARNAVKHGLRASTPFERRTMPRWLEEFEYEFLDLIEEEDHFVREIVDQLLMSVLQLRQADDLIGSRSASIFDPLTSLDRPGAATEREGAVDPAVLASEVDALAQLHLYRRRFRGRRDRCMAKLFPKGLP